tara:strand:+ start:516 stop:1415 length:900 start_codon:yes stop_codon:yes gene_type:complete
MAVTDVGVAAGGLGKTVAAAIVQFNKSAVTPQTLTMVAAMPGTNTVQIPVYAKADYASIVTNSASGAEETTGSAASITSAAVSLEVLRNNVFAQITDLAAYGNSDALMVNAGKILGNAVAAEFDNHACALFDGFATAVGHDDGLTFAVLMDAIANLEANDAPRPYSGVFHPKQVYGSFGLSNEFGGVAAVQASNGAFTGMGGGALEQQFMGAGFVTNIAGIDIRTSTAVPDGATGRKRGAVYAKSALGCGYIDFGGGNFIQLETQRQAAEAGTDIVANGYWEIAETVDLHGIEVDTEVA